MVYYVVRYLDSKVLAVCNSVTQAKNVINEHFYDEWEAFEVGYMEGGA